MFLYKYGVFFNLFMLVWIMVFMLVLKEIEGN